MHIFLITYQIIMVIICIAFIVMLERQKENTLSKIMLCIGFLGAFQNGSYLLEILSKSAGEAMTAIKLEYLAGAYIMSFLLIFVSKYCKYEMNRVTQCLIFTFDSLIVVSVWTYEYHSLFYKSVSFANDGYISHMKLEKGILFYCFVIAVVLKMIACFIMVYHYCKHTENRIQRLNTMMLGFCSTFPVFGFVVNFSDIIHGFDAIPGFVALSILSFAVVIIVFRVLDITYSAYESIIQTMNEAVIIVDKDGYFIEANNKAKSIFKILESYRKGQQLIEHNLNEIFADNQYFQYERDDCYYEIYTNKIVTEGVLSGYSIMFIDVTESKNQLKEMQYLQMNAEKANAAKSDFLAKMSHEIRTPINAIIGMNEMVLRESSEKEILKYANYIKGSSESLLGIINDILDFSKIESGKMEIIPSDYELNQLLDDIRNMIQIRADEKGLKFCLEIDPTIPNHLYGDDIRIKQILLNLLSNSVKYTPKGSVILRIKNHKIFDQNVELRFEVEDTGMGIKEEDQAILFTAFERIDEKKNRNIEGTGLGMSITSQLLKLMNSEIALKSEYGKGSVFSFHLIQPMRDDMVIGEYGKKEEKSSKRSEYKTLFTAPEANILIVDDNKVNRKVFIGLLKNTLLLIDDVESGKDCLEIIKHKHYDLIFMDHMMPNMDGIETLEKIKESSDHLCTDTPVIILTANSIIGAKEQYLSMGFKDFISKPIDYNKLENIIMHCLPQDKIIPSD